jgi:hypothetical protein
MERLIKRAMSKRLEPRFEIFVSGPVSMKKITIWEDSVLWNPIDGLFYIDISQKEIPDGYIQKVTEEGDPPIWKDGKIWLNHRLVFDSLEIEYHTMFFEFLDVFQKAILGRNLTDKMIFADIARNIEDPNILIFTNVSKSPANCYFSHERIALYREHEGQLFVFLSSEEAVRKELAGKIELISMIDMDGKESVFVSAEDYNEFIPNGMLPLIERELKLMAAYFSSVYPREA